jgi:hypothetical protein
MYVTILEDVLIDYIEFSRTYTFLRTTTNLIDQKIFYITGDTLKGHT